MKRKLNLVFGILLLLGVAVSVLLWFQVKNQNLTARPVSVLVTDVQKIVPADPRENTEYRVKAHYDGKEHEIHNIRNGFRYIVGLSVEVVEAGGVLYEDEDGVRSNTGIAYFYFGSLALNAVLLVALLSVRAMRESQ
ncbi:MAG: hypothetical protein Q4A52_05120 [Bacillota bacterium]|nr:hypothetical protein [Bacillota bacterium]